MISWIRRIWSWVFGGFLTAVSSVGGLSAFGIALGSLMVWAGEYWVWLNGHPTLSLLTEHLGMGFLVSAIAVFGYEWKGHSKKTLVLCEELVRTLAAQGEQALDRGLSQLIPHDQRRLPEGARDVTKSCKTVIMAISNLLQTRRRVTDHYVSFVAGLLRAVVRRNVEELVDLHLRDKEVTFRVPANAAVLADDILAEQMKAMIRGERYEVVSDLMSWRNSQLGDFHEATQAAVRKGVKVRRIFNLFRDDHEEEENLTTQEVERILTKHLQAMNQWKDKWGRNGYEVAVFGIEGGAQRAKELTKGKVRKMHFGIFRLADKEAVRFRVTKPDLSELLISRDPDEIREDIQAFDQLWECSSPLSAEVIRSVVDAIRPDGARSSSTDIPRVDRSRRG